MNFEWKIDHRPTITEIADEQSERGYHPLSFGPPHDIKYSEVDDGWFITWKCNSYGES